MHRIQDANVNVNDNYIIHEFRGSLVVMYMPLFSGYG